MKNFIFCTLLTLFCSAACMNDINPRRVSGEMVKYFCEVSSAREFMSMCSGLRLARNERQSILQIICEKSGLRRPNPRKTLFWLRRNWRTVGPIIREMELMFEDG
jgi:hypothetical protein